MQIMRFVRCLFLALVALAIPASSFAGVFVSVTIAPPALPVYTQPPCPGDGYIWTPGYWAYGPDGYYWVPGTWAVAPEPGLLWTPGYWGWNEGYYVWHAGYWGPHVGFYGGVNYGFGYVGVGYLGGYWRGRDFYYNRNVNNVRITNVHIYNKTVINNVTVNRISYNGGAGGIHARPAHFEQVAERERHFRPTNIQAQHERSAGSNREFLASVNHGRPSIAATSRPGEFHSRGAVAARPDNHGAPYRPAESRAMNRDVPHPQNSARSMERPMPRQDGYNNRGGQPSYSPRAENRGGPTPRPNAYRGESAGNDHGSRPSPSHGENARPQGDAPHGQDRGHEQRGH
jgi:hypothetical protein